MKCAHAKVHTKWSEDFLWGMPLSGHIFRAQRTLVDGHTFSGPSCGEWKRQGTHVGQRTTGGDVGHAGSRAHMQGSGDHLRCLHTSKHTCRIGTMCGAYTCPGIHSVVGGHLYK